MKRKQFVQTLEGEVEKSDLRPQGFPETVIQWKHQEHLGLEIKGQEVPALGLLAIRCEFDSLGECMPMTCAIAEDVLLQQARADLEKR